MKKISVLAALLICLNVYAQQNTVVAGPMLGHTELRTATVWMQFAKDVTSAEVLYRPLHTNGNPSKVMFELNGGEFNTAHAVLTALEPGTSYEYVIKVNGQPKQVASGTVTTQQLWQWRKPAPDFSFLTGSCAYFNEPVYDRPGKPYGGDSSIFEAMAKEKSDFMLWLGDNWYTREADYFSKWGLHYRATRDRSLPVLQPFLKSMPQYAIWDDHDYGYNDADETYILKDVSKQIFEDYWANPSYGMNGDGVYTKLSWNDVDVFMLDDRWDRSDDAMKDSVNGAPNPDKKMLGDAQMDWLENALLKSNANSQVSFRIIAIGSQVLNGYSPFDCFRHFSFEYNRLMKFLEDNKIKGVIFVTGDRHHSEVIEQKRRSAYTLYDITVSPFTSGVAKTFGAEINNPQRVGAEIDAQNYARFSFSGTGKDRKLTVTFLGVHGEQLGEWSVTLAELSDNK